MPHLPGAPMHVDQLPDVFVVVFCSRREYAFIIANGDNRMHLFIKDTAMTREFLDRVNGVVCTNGSSVIKVSNYVAALVFGDRFDLTAQELSTFVRNFVEEGFDSEISIK